MVQTAGRVCINIIGDKAFMNDAMVVGRPCDWSEHSLQSVTTVKTNGECEVGAKQEGWIRTKETTQQGVHLNGQAAFRVFGQAIFQPYERSPNLLHGCTFAYSGIMMHQMIPWICSDLRRAALEPQVSDSLKSFSSFGPRAFDKQVGSNQ